jgi:hypothetical protein
LVEVFKLYKPGVVHWHGEEKKQNAGKPFGNVKELKLAILVLANVVKFVMVSG